MNHDATEVTLSELEAAINWWRIRHPSEGDAMKLAPQVSALATVYALLIWQGEQSLAFTQLSDSAKQALSAFRAALTSPVPKGPA
jgi:hypothetical protein